VRKPAEDVELEEDVVEGEGGLADDALDDDQQDLPRDPVGQPRQDQEKDKADHGAEDGILLEEGEDVRHTAQPILHGNAAVFDPAPVGPRLGSNLSTSRVLGSCEFSRIFDSRCFSGPRAWFQVS
jgi:hypothetical protein